MVRIGIVGLLHESNTFVSQPTTVADFRRGTWARGAEVEGAFADSHHEIGGFLAALEHHPEAEAIPLFVARATPSGVITASAFQTLVDQLLEQVAKAGPLDGILAAPHGATVSEAERDADGAWLTRLRNQVRSTPIVGTLDAHANLSDRMVQQCNAIVAYRTNPHLDQRARGEEAAALLLRHLQGEIRLSMAALMPPLAINIERQCTDEPHFEPMLRLAAKQRGEQRVLSNSILLGFPYADVEEMGSAVLAVAADAGLAADSARELADALWRQRDAFAANLLGVDDALRRCLAEPDLRTCLLDMGDNVGGGSPADGTELLAEFERRGIARSLVCICDAEAVKACQAAGQDQEVELSVGGKTDTLHGAPVVIRARVRSFHDGRFQEIAPRHGGITDFNQGATAVIETQHGVTVVLNSIRTAPFSLRQLTSCDVDPTCFRILVAKGVNAPIAAYRDVCDRFLRVNTNGATCADMSKLAFARRRTPMLPFEPQTTWNAAEAKLVRGFESGA